MWKSLLVYKFSFFCENTHYCLLNNKYRMALNIIKLYNVCFYTLDFKIHKKSGKNN